MPPRLRLLMHGFPPELVVQEHVGFLVQKKRPPIVFMAVRHPVSDPEQLIQPSRKWGYTIHATWVLNCTARQTGNMVPVPARA